MGAITRLPFGENDPAMRRGRAFRGTARRAMPEVSARQARITLLAFRAYPDREAAQAFLHEADVALGGRPLDVAGESEAAWERVASALRQRLGLDQAGTSS